MARIRTIKPDYWTDDRVGECSPTARLLFIAMWNFADDEGSIDRSAKQLKAQAFPYDQLDCERLVQELLKAGLLIEYEADGKKYLHIKGFGVHQKIEKKARARFPLYKESLRTHRGVGEESGSSAVSSLGMEGNGKDLRTPLTPQRGAFVEGLDGESWEKWQTYRKQIGKPIKPASIPAAQRKLAGFGTSQAAVVEHSIAQSYTGLFAPQTQNGSARSFAKPGLTERLAALGPEDP